MKVFSDQIDVCAFILPTLMKSVKNLSVKTAASLSLTSK